MVRITSPFVFLFISPYTLQIFSITSSFPLFFAPVEQKRFICLSPKRRTMQAHRKRTHLLHSVDSFPLNLVVEVEVALVEVVNSHVSVLSAAGVALACGVSSDGVEGTEMASHTANLVFEHLVVETGLELTLTGRGSGNIHGGLTTTEDDEVLLGGNGGAIEGCVGYVGLKDLEVAGRNELDEVSIQ